MNYEIREMTPKDGARVLEIYKQGIDSKNSTFEQEVPTWEAWDINYLNFCRFVMEDENENIVGWCALLPYSKRNCFNGVAEISIYVDNEFQTKGLGSLLMQKLILDSEEHNIWTLQSGIFPENRASIALHQKHGFRLVGTREKIAKMNGVWRGIILMERRSNVVGI